MNRVQPMTSVRSLSNYIELATLPEFSSGLRTIRDFRFQFGSGSYIFSLL